MIDKTMVPFALINDGSEKDEPFDFALIQIMMMDLNELAKMPICTIADGRSIELHASINAYGLPERDENGICPALSEPVLIELFLDEDAVEALGIPLVDLINKTCEAYGVKHIVCCNWVG